VSPRFQLLVRCLSPKLAGDARLELTSLSPVGWAELVQESYYQEVLSLLYHRLDKHGLRASIPAQIEEGMRKFYLRTLALNTRLYRQLAEATNALDGANIATVALKGAHLVDQVYRDLAFRTVRDIDLLVRKADAVAAAEQLIKIGYEASGSLLTDRERTYTHHFPELTRPNSHPVELHWYPVNVDRVSPLNIDVDGIIERAALTSVRGCVVRLMTPEDLLLHLCLHHSYQHKFDLKLRHFYDLVEGLSRYQDRIDWGVLRDRALEWGALKHTYVTLMLVRDLFEFPDLERELRSLEPSGFEHRLTAWTKSRLFSITDPNAKPPSYFCAHFITIRRKPTLAGKARYLLRWMLLPPPFQLRLTYPRIRTGFQVWLYYLVNIKDCLRYLLYDIHFNEEEKDRIKFEAWCSSQTLST